MSADTNPTESPQTVPSPVASTTNSMLFRDDQPALFDELPTYKSVVPTAVASPIFGLLAALSFTSSYFILFGVAAILLALHALRQIKRFPERSTGEKLAQTGFGLGLMFILASLTITGTQALLRVKSANDFATQYAQLIATRPADDVLFFHGTPEGREGKLPSVVVEEMRKSTPQPEAFDSMTRPMQEVQTLVKTPGHTITFDGLEADGADGMRIFAVCRFKITGPGTSRYPGPEQYLLVRMNGRTMNGRTAWMVDEFRFPYQPKTGIPKDNVVP